MIVLAIAASSIREHSRRKFILFFAVFSLLLMAAMLYATKDSSAEAVFGPRGEIATFAALGVLEFLAVIAALAVSMGTIGQPFANGEAALTLARPVARWQFALGRYLGSAAVIAGLCLLLAVESQIVEFAGASDFSPMLWGHWGVTAFNLMIVAAMTSVASVFFSAPVLAAVVGFFALQASQIGRVFYTLVRNGFVHGTLAKLFRLAWYVTPKQLPSPLETNQAAATNQMPTGQVIDFVISITPGLVIWAAVWLVGLLALTLYLTQRKEI